MYSSQTTMKNNSKNSKKAIYLTQTQERTLLLTLNTFHTLF